jgi:hypothetical protein
MKRIAIAAALVFASAVSSAALAASHESREGASSADTEQSAPSRGEGDSRGPRLAEGFFDRFRHGEGEHGRHHRHHWDDDDDDDDDDHGSASANRGGASRPADPNGAGAPVPDSGVFNGKARPKVEVQ